MALDPSIILAGRQPDILGAMERGNALVGQVNESRRQNARAQYAQFALGRDGHAGPPAGSAMAHRCTAISARAR